MGLIEKAKGYDRKRKVEINEGKFTDDEIMLVGAWFEGDVSSSAVAHVLNIHNTNVYQKVSTILKVGITIGRVGFVWYPKEGVRDENKDK